MGLSRPHPSDNDVNCERPILPRGLAAFAFYTCLGYHFGTTRKSTLYRYM